MKRHIQNAGLKKWFGDYLCELESEPLKAIDRWASAYEGCILSGGDLTLVSGTTYNVASALVVLKIDGEYKVAPLPATNSVDVSVQKAIRLKKTAVTGQYQNPSDLTIAYDYSAEIIDYTSGLGTLNQDYLLIPTSGGAIRAYTDVVKGALAVVTSAAKGLMSAADKTKLDGVATNANNYEHQAQHSPSIIAQDSNNRFVTDTQITKLAGIAENANNYVHPSQHSPGIIAQDSSNRFVTDAERNNFWSGDGSTKLNTSKNVGIGTSSPTEKLDVAGSIGLTNNIYQKGTSVQLDINPYNTLRIGRSTNNTNFGVYIFKGDGTNTPNHFLRGNGDSYLANNNGNLGLGTSSPTEKLDVVGNIRCNDVIIA